MAKKKDHVPLTVRLSPDLKAQIEARAKVNNRSQTGEIEYLLAKVLDETVERDFGPSRD